MVTRLKLKPGQRGTKKLLAEHGDALVCDPSGRGEGKLGILDNTIEWD